MDSGNEKAGDPKGSKKKRDPRKRCVVMFCNNTNAQNVSLHQFPKNDRLRQQWIQFVLTKRDDNWQPGSGHICSNHFSPECYHGMGAKLAGFASRLKLKDDAVLTIQVSPTVQQLDEARRLKRKLPPAKTKADESSDRETPKRRSRALSKLTANRVRFFYTTLNLTL